GCWKSLETIAAEMGTTRRHVARAIAEAEAAGVIVSRWIPERPTMTRTASAALWNPLPGPRRDSAAPDRDSAGAPRDSAAGSRDSAVTSPQGVSGGRGGTEGVSCAPAAAVTLPTPLRDETSAGGRWLPTGPGNV